MRLYCKDIIFIVQSKEFFLLKLIIEPGEWNMENENFNRVPGLVYKYHLFVINKKERT